MATEYGCNISNKFAFLGDDDETDPDVLLARAAKEKKEKQRLAKQVKTAPVAPEPVKPVANNTDRRSGPRPPRRDNGEKREFRPRREGEQREFRPRREGEQQVRRDGERRPPRRPREETGEVVEGGERQRRSGGGNRPFRRQDRDSRSDKTGVKAVPKKDGHGKGNWGDDNDEIVAETENLNVSDNKENGENVEQPQEAVEEVPEEEKEPPKFTLSEWKAQQQVVKKEFKTREANEGADQKALQKFVPLKKEDEDEEDEYEEVEHIAQTKRQQSQKTLDIHVNFNDPSRRDNRGERRFNDRRPGGDRNQQRGPRQDTRSAPRPGQGRRGPQIDLAHDFPALGA